VLDIGDDTYSISMDSQMQLTSKKLLNQL